jgi:hypothetical protein
MRLRRRRMKRAGVCGLMLAGFAGWWGAARAVADDYAFDMSPIVMPQDASIVLWTVVGGVVLAMLLGLQFFRARR